MVSQVYRYQCNDPAYFRRSLLVKGVPRLTVPVRHPLDGHLPWDACDGNCEYARWSIGDRLWVRENFLYRNQRQSVLYQADFDRVEASGVGAMYGGWKPSIHLPRKFCRIVLEVEDVGLQRLHEITEEEAVSEGFGPIVAEPWWQGYRDVPGMGLIQQQHRGAEPPDWMIEPKPMAISDPLAKSALSQFRLLWEAINGDRGFGWSTNCYVWRVQFKLLEGLA